ncbi:MAG: GNAT family N-acetyltransferase [Anaerolineae bacterium]|nr:GNAT family N-acetyltransferase [Anaerolineae bacterium]
MEPEFEMVTVDATNVDEHRFFCYKSKPKSEGYRRKRAWLDARFAEGLRLHQIYEGKRSVAFVETIPGEFAWRAVAASGYLFIHCLWVVGKGKGKGYAAHLLAACEAEARAEGRAGVAMATSSGVWLADKPVLVKCGYEVVAAAPPSFELLVKRFDDAPLPTFPADWKARAARYGSGLTILRTDQCPYIPDAVTLAQEAAAENGIPARVVTYESAAEVQAHAPSPYGVFNLVYDGQLLSYHYLLKKDFPSYLSALKKEVTG